MSDTPIWNTSKHLDHTKDLSIGYFRKHQSLPPISTQHSYKIHNQHANQLSTKSLSQSVSPATNEILSANQIANKALKSLTNQRKELTKITRNKRQKMQSNNSFRKPIGSPFRRPLIPTERKSPTNENHRSVQSPIKPKVAEIRTKRQCCSSCSWYWPDYEDLPMVPKTLRPQVNFDIDEVLHAIATHEETTYKDLEIEPLVLPSYKDLPTSKTNNIS